MTRTSPSSGPDRLGSQHRGRRVGALLFALTAVGVGSGAPVGRPLLAQASRTQPTTLTGTVRDSASGAALAGAAVLLRDSLDHTLGQAVTDARGRYYVASAPTARRLRVQHIGFRAADLAWGADGGPPRELSLAAVPPLLAPVRVTATAHCPKRTNGPDALGLLDQVRAGLLATVIARAEQPRALTVLSYERDYLPGDDDRYTTVGHQSVHVRTGGAIAAPFGASRTGAEFVANGFREDSGRVARYYAPDAETLVDDDFAGGYCFRVVAPDATRPQQVGLGFAAARHHDGRVDLDGVLWIDTVARSLRDLTFDYVGLPRAVTTLHPGGRLSFREMPNGVAFIDRWSLRVVRGGDTPADDEASRAAAGGSSSYASPTFGARPRALPVAVREIGGELAHVTWSDDHSWQAPLGAWRLHLSDTHGHAAAGAVVHVQQTDYTGTADAAGVVELTNLLPGPYTASIADPMLAADGRGHGAELRVVVARDTIVDSRATVEMSERVVARAPTPNASSPGVPTLQRSRDSASMARNDGHSVESILTGRFPGVVVTQTPDGGIQVRIRGGANSFVSGEEPLYVVDGTPLSQGTTTLGFLNPNDIERIEVLKNVQDTAIYGLRGTNGVIRITTTRPGRR